MNKFCPKATWIGRFEIDFVEIDGSNLGTFKRRTLEELGLDKISADSDDEYACVPHLHALVVHPGVSRHKLGLYLKMQFPGFRRVEAKLRTSQKLQTSISKISQYMTKMRPPEWALYGHGSRTYKPRNAEVILMFNDLMKAFGHRKGWLCFDSDNPPSFVR
jgi:hypothetical protein